MASIRIDNFLGLNLKKDPAKAPFWQALVAKNCEVSTKSIGVAYALGATQQIQVPVIGSYKSVYHLGTGSVFAFDPGAQGGYEGYLGTDYFITLNHDADFAPSPLAADGDHRVYYSAGYNYEPRVTNAILVRLGGLASIGSPPAASYVLGVPAQPKIGAISAAGGSGPVQDRAYVYTYVTPWGEEGPPSAPTSVIANETGATVLIERMGTTSRRHSTAVPIVPAGIPANVTFVGAPTPGYLQFDFTVAGYNRDLREGDRIYASSPGVPNAGNRDFLVSAASSAGNGWVRVAANAWDFAANTVVFRGLPVNTFNVVAASSTKANPTRGRHFVDTIEGLRVGEEVWGPFGGGTTLLVHALSAEPANPWLEILGAGASVAGDTFHRGASHNLGEAKITGVASGGGFVTLTLDSRLELVAGDRALILGVMGAYQVNGVREFTGVLTNTVSFAYAPAVGAYTSGGVVLIPIPYTWREYTVTNVVSAGGPYPASFTITYTLAEPHDFAVGEMVLGYDIGGAVEANNVGTVSAVGAATVTVQSATGVTAYTAGGKLVKVERQSRKRLYRTAQGTTDAEYQLVADLPSETARYTDTKNDTALGETLATDDWIGPPTNLHSIQAHPHGFLEGLSGKTLCRSEPYAPHAWPLKYQRPIPADATALGIFSNTTVVLTLDVPYLFTGTHPSSMQRERLSGGERCEVKRSVANGPDGVAYQGLTGMHFVGFPGAPVRSTRDLLPESLFSAADTVSAVYNGKLVWIVSGATVGYVLDLRDGNLTQIDVGAGKPITELHVSPITGDLWVVANTNDMGILLKANGSPARFTWESQIIRFEKPESLGFFQGAFDWALQSATMQDREAALKRNLRLRGAGRYGAWASFAFAEMAFAGDDLEAIYSPDTTVLAGGERYLKLTIIAEPGNPRQTTVFDDFVTNEEPVSFANGIKSDTWQVKLMGNVPVSKLSLATTESELKSL